MFKYLVKEPPTPRHFVEGIRMKVNPLTSPLLGCKFLGSWRHTLQRSWYFPVSLALRRLMWKRRVASLAPYSPQPRKAAHSPSRGGSRLPCDHKLHSNWEEKRFPFAKGKSLHTWGSLSPLLESCFVNHQPPVLTWGCFHSLWSQHLLH